MLKYFIPFIFLHIIIFQCKISMQMTHKSCATFVPSEKIVSSNKLALTGDFSVIGNIQEEYATPDQTWNVSGTWEVSSSSDQCELTCCSETHLTGNCQQFTSGQKSSVGIWSSVSCKCRQKCSCSQIHLEESVCAHAYFEGKSCNDCDAEYIQLGNKVNDVSEHKFTSFLIRPGCTLTLYEEEEEMGDSIDFVGPTTGGLAEAQTWTNYVGSSSCHCDENEYNEYIKRKHNQTLTRSTLRTPITIPDTIDEILVHLKKTNNKHPGLLAAFSSMVQRRSSKNNYILFLGTSGAGKSSAINFLLGENISHVGDQKSTTSQIIELRVPIDVPTLEANNTELRVIDTPGLGDTDGIELDAATLATLDKYLSEHEELQSKLPNLVLIFHPFTDNRFDGEGSSFVKMVQKLNLLREKFTDENFSNVVFVFTHFCSESRNLQRNPIAKLMKFKEVVEQFSLFPKPILTAVAENLAKENDLKMVNDNFILPNKELYPANLINKLITITTQSKDLIGKVILEEAFLSGTRSKHANVVKIENNLVNSHHPLVSKYLGKISSIVFHSDETQVSKSLTTSYAKMNPSLKSSYPNSLNYTKHFLNLRYIQDKTDLPQTTSAILELVKKMDLNEAVNYLLESGLGVHRPRFPTSSMVGYGYNVFKDDILSSSPYKLNQFQSSSGILYKLPKGIIATEAEKIENELETFNNRDSYIISRMGRLGVKANLINTALFTGTVKPGYVIDTDKCKSNKCIVVAARNYDLFQLSLNEDDAEITAEFKRSVSALPDLNLSNHLNVEKWTNFLNNYGTHIVKTANAGGTIHIHASTQQNKYKLISTSVFKVIEFADNVTSLRKWKETSLTLKDLSHNLQFVGGNSNFHTSDLTNLKVDNAMELMRNWRKSLLYNLKAYPVELIPISEVVEAFNPDVASYVDEAIQLYIGGKLKFSPTPPDNSVRSTQLVADMSQQHKQLLAGIKQLEQHLHELKKQQQTDIKASAAAKRDMNRRTRQLNIQLREEQRWNRMLEQAKQVFDRQLQVAGRIAARKPILQGNRFLERRSKVIHDIYNRKLNRISRLIERKSRG